MNEEEQKAKDRRRDYENCPPVKLFNAQSNEPIRKKKS